MKPMGALLGEEVDICEDGENVSHVGACDAAGGDRQASKPDPSKR